MFVSSGSGTEVGLTEGMITALESTGVHNGRLQLFAGSSSGIYQSGDLGESWSRIATSDSGMGPILALAISPFFGIDQTMVAGTPNGIWQSSNGGRSWRHLVTGGQVNAIALSPAEERQYRIYAGTEEDGVLRSEDAGRNWYSGNPGLLDLTILSLAVATGSHRSELLFTGTSTGLYRSTNAGKAWRPVDLPIESVAVECLELISSPGLEPIVLVGTEANGLLKSDTNGRNWESVKELGPTGITAIASTRSSIDRQYIACATGSRLAVSIDYGTSWNIAAELQEPVLSLLVLEVERQVVLVAGLAELGIVRSLDGGATWERAILLVETDEPSS